MHAVILDAVLCESILQIITGQINVDFRVGINDQPIVTLTWLKFFQMLKRT